MVLPWVVLVSVWANGMLTCLLLATFLMMMLDVLVRTVEWMLVTRMHPLLLANVNELFSGWTSIRMFRGMLIREYVRTTLKSGASLFAFTRVVYSLM